MDAIHEVELIRELNRNRVVRPESFDPHFKHLENEDFMLKLRKEIDEDLMLKQRYLFIKRSGNRVDTKCSHCGHKGKLKHVKKNQSKVICENCKSELTVRNIKYQTSMYTVHKEFIYFANSTLSNEIIIAYQLLVSRRIDGKDELDALTIIDDISEVNRYYYDVKSPSRMMTKFWGGNWNFRNTMFHTESSVFEGVETDSLINAIKKSEPFKYFPISCIKWSNTVKLVELYAKYPDIEKLEKIGLGSMITDYTKGHATFSSLNWKGKTVQKMLKLNKAEIRVLLNRRGASFYELYVLQQLKAAGISLDNLSEVEAAFEISNHTTQMKPKELFSYAKPTKLMSYFNDQQTKFPKRYYLVGAVARDYVDMLSDMKLLNMDMDRRKIFPKNLDKTHQDIAMMVTIEENKEKDAQINQVAEKLSKFKIISHGYAIFPASSATDLIIESKTLGHCVKNYINRYASGDTNIFLMRKVECPERPHYTIEIGKNLNLIQCRGKGNQAIPNEETDAKKALDAFMAKLSRKQKGAQHEQRIAN